MMHARPLCPRCKFGYAYNSATGYCEHCGEQTGPTLHCPHCGFTYAFDPSSGYCSHCRKHSKPQTVLVCEPDSEPEQQFVDPGLVKLDPQRHTLEAWSTEKVPFEPQTRQQHELRSRIRAALDHESMQPSAELLARIVAYAGPECEATDVENAACYNMGRWNSLSAAYNSLVIERAQNTPSPPDGLPTQRQLHYWRYALTPVEECAFQHWVPREEDAVEIKPFAIAYASLADPKAIWFHARTTMRDRLWQLAGWEWLRERSRFGMLVSVAVPRHAWPAARVKVKPVLDGTIASLHQHTDPKGLSRLAQHLGRPVAEVCELAAMRKGSVLGEHEVFLRHGDGVQVSPRDDLCAAVRITLSMTQGDMASVGFCIFDLAPVTA